MLLLLLLDVSRGGGTGFLLANETASSKALGLLNMRGFGTGTCNAGSCSKAAGTVVRVWLEIHAKEETLHARNMRCGPYLQHACIMEA
jgi:signal transduction histidine kinase